MPCYCEVTRGHSKQWLCWHVRCPVALQDALSAGTAMCPEEGGVTTT